MFQKPTFGSNTSGFGSFNTGATTSSPFGGFKPAAGASAFGAPPAFGATPANTAPGGGLFGQTNTTGGLFGASTSTNPTPSFGSSGFGSFGASTSTGGLFGANTPSTGGLFGNNQNANAFGAKPAGFGFGATASAAPTTGGLFSSPASTNTGGLFSSQPAGGGLFSSGGAFGQQQASGTAHVKYQPVAGTDVVVKGGNSQTVNIRHHCITCMKEYETKSLEELRLEDYTAGRKGSSGMFGFQQPADNTVKPLFNTGAFGQTATTTAPSLFGGGSMANTSGFGQTNTFSFGNNAQNTSTTGLFGANKPAFGATPTTGTSLFGATTTQAPAFGTNTSTFGFGSNTQNQQTGGLFGAKPATGAFGAPATSTGFGAFGGGGLFGAKTAQTSAPTFGTTTPAFGANTSAFGANTSTSLFGGGSTFGKPATSQPTFGFNSQPQMGTGQNTGLGTSFQAKPTAFNNLGTGTSLFSQPNYNLQSGLNLGLGGGGLFNNNTSLGGTGLGLGQNNANTSMVQSGGLGAPAGSNVHEQILTLAARPYGDSPLFKDLLPDTSTTAEDVLKPTNPVAVKAILDGSSGYSVTSPPPPPLRVVPRALARDKKSLFDGLEESDASLEDKLSLKPSRKRLVLRPKKDGNDSLNRSLEDQSRLQENGPKQTDQLSMDRVDHDISNRERDGDERRSSERKQYEELQADKQNSWPSRNSWENQEKPIDNDPTPRLYPNLDKELPAHISERRASWLTTKPLRKPLVSNPDLVENSVRELGVRTDRSTPSNNDKENIDSFYVSEEENVSTREVPPHPAGVKLTRPGYYTIPSLEEMTKYLRPDGTCVVPHLTIGRRNYGNVFYNCEIDVAGLDLDALVHFLNKEVIIYPEDGERPPVGEGLNRKAIVTLDRVWPRDKTEKRPVTEPERLLKMDFEGKLRRVCDKHDTQFIEYRPQTGSWVFKVEHFSKYGLTESDEEDEITPEVMKRQLVTQTLQKAAPVAPKPPTGAPARSPLAPATGLGGLASLGGDDVFLQTSLNLMNGSRGFEMDTTEDNTEGASLYQESRAFGVKSPTSELARLEHRQSHNVQLMKASLYADTEMEDDVSISTGDQLVPHASSAIMTVPTPSISHKEVVEETPIIVNEPVMRPLIVQPHTVILEYNRKIPPFKKTIAGRLNASCIADMSVCRARHTRVCFGPENQMLYLTTARAVADMPKDSAMSELDRYVCGRADDDWSEAILARVQLGRAEVKAVQDLLSRQLASLLEFSTRDATTTRPVARLVVRQSPADRKRLLDTLLADAEKGEEFVSAFGVSSAFCVEVWKLCEALWGDDLLNDGIPGTDEQSVVSRHTNFLNWLKDAVAKSTYKDLATSTIVTEDDKDAHSANVWTLFVGGRILEACKLCKQHGDLNMAALIAQASGDPFFKTLIARQLQVWRECGADELVSPHKMALLCLLAGRSPGAELQTLDWLRVLHVCARYICPQIPSLERIVRTYEALFSRESNVDLASLPEENVTMRLPIPDYCEDYTVSVETNGKSRRVLDLRYELIRARAFNTRPRLSPATYTPHPIDYSLSFLISAWFGTPSVESVVGIAEQLEGYGLWHLAVQALLYHPDDGVRSYLVRSVLSRHAPAQADTTELKSRLDLLRKLGVPEKWILIAQAHRAKYENRRQLEVEHLVSAECYSDAHSVLVEHILPDVVLSDNVKSIQPIIEKLHAAAQRHEVSGWERGGEALYHYIHVCDEIRGLVSDAEGDQCTSVQERLEALTPMVTAAARALIAWDCTSPLARAARTQMGARLVRLAPRAPLLRDLRLPPDTAAPQHRQIATELAERAAELCLESAAGEQSGP